MVRKRKRRCDKGGGVREEKEVEDEEEKEWDEE